MLTCPRSHSWEKVRKATHDDDENVDKKVTKLKTMSGGGDDDDDQCS